MKNINFDRAEIGYLQQIKHNNKVSTSNDAMSAKQLQEFIGVIETAERLASRENDLASKRRSTSSLWSYPTDIFTPLPRDIGSNRSPSASPLRARRPLDKLPPHHGTNEQPQVTIAYLILTLSLTE